MARGDVDGDAVDRFVGPVGEQVAAVDETGERSGVALGDATNDEGAVPSGSVNRDRIADVLSEAPGGAAAQQDLGAVLELTSLEWSAPQERPGLASQSSLVDESVGIG